jgi:hypothetical protein
MVKIPVVVVVVVVDRSVWRRGRLVRETTMLTQRLAFSAVFKKSVCPSI